MTFPHIEDIRDVLPFIEGKDEIKVKEYSWFTAIDYMVQMEHTFDSDMARECRGIKFYKNGTIAARPFHKFFNRREHPDLEPQSEDYIAEEKLDGSMVHGILNPNHGDIRLMTKAGFSDVAIAAERFIMKQSSVELDAIFHAFNFELNNGLTPIFEYVGPNNRIVLRYDEENLIYLTSRDNVTGEYVRSEHLVELFNSPEVYDLTDINNVHEWTDREGVVLVWENGERLKIKADDYVLKHKTKDNINQEKNVLKLVLDDGVDDLAGILDEEDFNRVVRYQDLVLSNMREEATYVEDLVAEHGHRDRADLGKNFVPTLDKPFQPVFWKTLNGNDAFETIKKMLETATSRQRKIDEYRCFIGTFWNGTLAEE